MHNPPCSSPHTPYKWIAYHHRHFDSVSSVLALAGSSALRRRQSPPSLLDAHPMAASGHLYRLDRVQYWSFRDAGSRSKSVEHVVLWVIYDPTQSPLEETASYILNDYTMSTFLNRMHGYRLWCGSARSLLIRITDVYTCQFVGVAKKIIFHGWLRH